METSNKTEEVKEVPAEILHLTEVRRGKENSSFGRKESGAVNPGRGTRE